MVALEFVFGLLFVMQEASVGAAPPLLRVGACDVHCATSEGRLQQVADELRYLGGDGAAAVSGKFQPIYKRRSIVLPCSLLSLAASARMAGLMQQHRGLQQRQHMLPVCARPMPQRRHMSLVLARPRLQHPHVPPVHARLMPQHRHKLPVQASEISLFIPQKGVNPRSAWCGARAFAPSARGRLTPR